MAARPRLRAGARGKSGLHGGTVPGNARRGRGSTPNPRESATENRPPEFTPARVKRWGKSPPRPRQRGWHGKPHREQGQIGTTGRQARGRLRSVVRVDRTRPRATAVPDEWPSPRRPPGLRGTEPGLQAIRTTPISACCMLFHMCPAGKDNSHSPVSTCCNQSHAIPYSSMGHSMGRGE